jgi:predicted nucleic acid-binding protein
VIYLDTSVFLAEILREKRRPVVSFWSNQLFSSRLLEYEVLVRLHALRKPARAITAAQQFLGSVLFCELDAQNLARTLQPFPVAVRTLDAIHLSTIVFLQSRGITIELATYDKRLANAATVLGIPLAKV